MQALLQQAIDHVIGAARYRWQALMLAWLVCILGWVVVLILPDMYEARARVYVDTRTSLAPVLQGLAINQDLNAQLNLVRQSLLGRPQLERVAREADLGLEAATPESQAQLLARLRERIGLDGRDFNGGTVYTISFTSEGRDSSLKVVEILLNAFVEDTLGGKRTNAETAQVFLRDQIQDYEQRLRDAEQRLADFKRRNVGQMPGAQGDYFTRLQQEMEAVTKVKANLSIAVTRRDELNRQLRGEPATAAGRAILPPPDTTTDVGLRIKEAQARLDDLLLRFTDRHPDVISTRQTLEQLEKRRQQEMELLRGGNRTLLLANGANANPVLQSIQLALNEADVEIAALRGELADRERNVAGLRNLVDTVPEVEAEFSKLNRDYDVTRGQYSALVERLDKARLGEQAEATESIRFEVIDPPSSDFKPVSPNRPLLMAAVLIVGLGAGGGLAYLLHLLNPVFASTRALNEVTGLPVLGVVSMTWVERFRSRERRGYVVYAAVAVLLLVVFAAVLQLQPLTMRFAQRLVG